jgi:hypothetical protein
MRFKNSDSILEVRDQKGSVILRDKGALQAIRADDRFEDVITVTLRDSAGLENYHNLGKIDDVSLELTDWDERKSLWFEADDGAIAILKIN